jgi:microsomal dipeptidase-like Zn-dependent dipeptidase
MNRREFLQYALCSGTLLALGAKPASAQTLLSNKESLALLRQFRVIDAHAHLTTSSDLKSLREQHMAGSVSAALGDRVSLSRGRERGTEYSNTVDQLESIRTQAQEAGVKLVMHVSDIPEQTIDPYTPGMILSIEGGDALEGKPGNVDVFYNLGVRLITIMHYRINELGDIMTENPKNKGLTPTGKQVVERMQSLGMVVDVAHADSATLKDIVSMSAKPVIDSHTSMCRKEDTSRCGRLRGWDDMELVAKAGGMIGTWPLAHTGRETFEAWAKELFEMKKRLGMEHIGLGTDDGGRLPSTVKGYRDTGSLGNLARAMMNTGFSRDDIAAFFGGNFLRVLKTCIG